MIKNIYMKLNETEIDEDGKKVKAYAVDGKKIKNAKKLTKHDDTDVIHCVCQDPEEISRLKYDPGYLAENLTELAIVDPDVRDEIVYVSYEKTVDGEVQSVRATVTQWIADGRPAYKSINPGHEYAGVSPEVSIET